MIDNIAKILGEDAQYLLEHKCDTIKKDNLHLPGPDFNDRIFNISGSKIYISDKNEVVIKQSHSPPTRVKLRPLHSLAEK